MLVVLSSTEVYNLSLWKRANLKLLRVRVLRRDFSQSSLINLTLQA